MVLQDSASIERGHPAAIPEIKLTHNGATGTDANVWPAAQAFIERRVIVLDNPESMFGPLPGWLSM